jgi:putative ABC transport system permease protein
MKPYDWLLALYPRHFRDRFGAGMRAAFTADYAHARLRGRGAAMRYLAISVLHALWFGCMERLPRPAAVRSFLSADLRDAVRALWATPIVTAVSVLSLALGIGANTALFTILNGLVIRQLPVREPERLVIVGRTDWTNPIWEQIRERQYDLFESACAWSFEQFNLAGAGRTDPVDGAYVSGGLFHTLGIDTIAGRPLTPADDVRGGGPDGHVAVISYRFWQKRFGGARDALGRSFTVNRVPFTIVGVAPPGFLGPEVGQAMDVFVPLSSEAAIRGTESALDGRSSWWLQVMARLEPNQTADEVIAALDALRPVIRDATMPPNYNAEYRANYLRNSSDFPQALIPAATGVSSLRNRFEEPLTIIMIVVGAVLLIACANIANLTLARAAARRHELSIRLALGASRGRLACLLLAESLLLAVSGGVAGLALARFGAALLVGQLESDVSAVTLDMSIDWRVLGFTAAVSLGATLLFGLAPALGVGSVEPNDALKDQSRGVKGERRLGFRNTLVVAQVGLSFALVAGAGLFVRTFTTLTTTPLGFDPSRLLIVNLAAPSGAVTRETYPALAQRVADEAAAVPGVARASLSYLTPLSGRNWTHRVQVSGGPTLGRTEQTTTINAVGPGWFETYGMKLLAGRDVAASDGPGSEAVAVVNEAFVRRSVGAQSPIGQRITALGLGKLDCVIVGVVNDAVYRTLRLGATPTIYLPMAQADAFGSQFSVTARLTSARPSVERGLTDAVSRTAPNLTFSFRDYTDQVRATVIQERLVAMLSGFFGLLAMLLAALGLYGVTAYSVNRRRPEIAVRMALGASTGGVVRLVLGRVATLLAFGAAIGFGLSLWTAKFIGSLLFHVDARDPATLAGAAALLVAVGLFAGWVPARKVSRLDPTVALRS